MKNTNHQPNLPLKSKEVFGFSVPFPVKGFPDSAPYVPEVDEAYQFDSATTQAILAGFMFNKRVLVHGYHGTGKSTHIEQVAARLNWPCLRVNLDGHISRLDLLGRDVIALKDGQQISEFQSGVLPWAMEHGVALVLDEYDAGRPDVMFVIQRVLEDDGRLTLLEQNRVIQPHPHFRLFATANTIGLGDSTGLYHGTNALNQGQLDRWNIISQLNYLGFEPELSILQAKYPKYVKEKRQAESMVAFAELTRTGFMAGDLSTVMSPRTVLNWAENISIFGDLQKALDFTFTNRCETDEQPLLHEYYERCFAKEFHDKK